MVPYFHSTMNLSLTTIRVGHILTGDEGQGPHGLLHGDLGDRREVEVRVVGHDDAAKQDRHDACR